MIIFLEKTEKKQDELCKEYKTLIVSLANFLYKIALNDRDKRLLWKSFRKNKKMLILDTLIYKKKNQIRA